MQDIFGQEIYKYFNINFEKYQIKELLHSKVINFDRVKDTLSGICLDL